MTTIELIQKWEIDLELYKRVIEDPVMYTEIERAKAAGKVMAISVMIAEVKSLSINTFEEAAKPLMKYLAENHHPHMVATIESNTAVLWEGQKSFKTNEFIVD